MKKLIALLAVMIAMASATAPAAACTDARPTGQVGYVPAPGYSSTYITGIVGTGGPSIRVYWKYAGFNTLHADHISLGQDTGITTVLGTGWPGTTAANRVTSVHGATSVMSDGFHYYLKVNNNYLEFVGNVAAITGALGQFRGVNGVLQMVKGGVGQDSINPSLQVGRFEFYGLDNGSPVSSAMSLHSSNECDYPSALLDVGASRGALLARSFFPEIERATRQWWQG